MVRTRVASSDWCASRNVVSVTSTSVCARRSAAKPSGPELEQPLPGAVGRGHVEVDVGGSFVPGSSCVGAGAVRLVDRHLGQPASSLVPRSAACGGQQLRVLSMNDGGDVAGDEVGVLQHGLQERDVGADAADPELGQRPAGPGDGRVEVRPRQVSLTSIESKCALISTPVSAVPPSSRTPAPPAERYVGDRAGVGPEAVGRVLGGDPALQGRAVDPDRVLGEAEVGERLARRRSASGTAPGRRR